MDTPEIITEHREEPLSQELIIARFKTFAKEHFQDSVNKDVDYLQYIKQYGQLYSFKLGEEKSELFIHYDVAPFFWLCDTPSILKMEEWLRNESRGRISSVEGYKSIKDFYVKWVILKSEQEKKYYALSTIKLIEREVNPNNILKLILHAVILTYDRKLYSPDKAIALLNESLQKLQQLRVTEAVKKNLSYVITIFTAFAYMKQNAFMEANQVLNEALSFNPNGITAKFYLALSAKKIGDHDSAISILDEIVSFDKDLIQFAVENNNLPLLEYYAHNAITYNIFSEYDFADMLEEIAAIINATKGLENLSYDHLGSIVIKLHDLFLEEFYTEEVTKTIDFLEKVYQSLTGNQNAIVAFSKPFLREKITFVTDSILNSIRKKYEDEITEKLVQYDMGINDNQETIKHLTKESEEVKKAYQKKLEDALNELEKNVADNISAVEYKIENIQQDRKFDPQSAFNNSMVYNIIVTLMVFIVGGFVGCYGGTIEDVYSFKDVMGTVVISGLKWSAITFLLGIIICMFSAAFAYIDRINEKQRLLKKITYLKSYKERETEVIKKNNEKKLKSFLDSFAERIEEHIKNCNALQKEKDERLAVLQADVDEKLKTYSEKLQSVYT
ncbi:MAG: hypothetical protein Q8933_06140 [Bacteroidota bacterium]|nr:hypothetical protein [Bacteroidota bacterium]MDP4194673.1 hypothetical protein [Bacteroidota bacterium]